MYPFSLYFLFTSLVLGFVALVYVSATRTKARHIYLGANILLLVGYVLGGLFYIDSRKFIGEPGIPPLLTALATFLVFNIFSLLFRLFAFTRRWDQWVLLIINSLPAVAVIIQVGMWMMDN